MIQEAPKLGGVEQPRGPDENFRVINYSRWILGLNDEEADRLRMSLLNDDNVLTMGLSTIDTFHIDLRRDCNNSAFGLFCSRYIEERVGRNISIKEVQVDMKGEIENMLGSIDTHRIVLFEAELLRHIRGKTSGYTKLFEGLKLMPPPMPNVGQTRL